MTRLGVAGFGANAMPTVAPRFRRLRLGARLAGVAAVVLGRLASPGRRSAAGADEAAEQRLAERFAPVVRLVHQDTECGPGEPFRPSDVDAVLDNSTVALRGPWDQDDLVAVAPTAEDLGAGLSGYHLDFPGNPLEPGCDYERWSRTATAGFEATTYAHVAIEPGREDRLAVQYWFFYPFNDYTNKHEGDWEMVQLLFATTDATQALDELPDRGGLHPARGRRGGRLGRTRSCRSSTGLTRSCTWLPARTPTSTTPRSTSAGPPSRGSAVTTQ